MSAIGWIRRRVLLLCIAAFLASPDPATAASAWNPGNRFLIGAWSLGGERDPARLVQLQEDGFDFIQVPYGGSVEQPGGVPARIDSLRAARTDFRLRLVGDATLLNRAPESGGASLMGWLVADEPCDRAALKAAAEKGQTLVAGKQGSGKLAWTLLRTNSHIAEPCFEESFGKDKDSGYEAYLETYLAGFDGALSPAPAPLLAIGPTDRTSPTFLMNLKTASARAAQHSRAGSRIPLWVVVPATPVRPAGASDPEAQWIAEIRSQAYCAAAYGAKGIIYRGGEIADLPATRLAALGLLNRELHALGPTLMDLDPVAVFHVSTLDQTGIGEDLLENYLRPYGIVASVKGSGAVDCMIGYFKRAGAGDDYLFVVNKNVKSTRSFKINLVSPADSVERVSKTSGARELVATAASGFEVKNLPPATGELYRIADGVFEYLAGVNDLREDGTKAYYVMNRGILCVDYATGARSWTERTHGKASATLHAEPLGVVRVSRPAALH